MPVVASLHVADLGARRALGVLRRQPAPGSLPGLRHANVATAAPLSGSVVPTPAFGRVGLVAFWDNDNALDQFLADHPLAATFAGGWHTRLEAVRTHGTWPGLNTDVPHLRSSSHEGHAVVLTLGRLRFSQTVRFLRTSAKASAGAMGAPGLIWATGLARPPFVSTCSLWESAGAVSAYAYGEEGGAHPHAIEADVAKPFHRESAFIRFRPYGAAGSLSGRNPLFENALAS
jgi:hypothetical protein